MVNSQRVVFALAVVSGREFVHRGGSPGATYFQVLLPSSIHSASVVSRKFFEKQMQVPFGVAQGRLSTHHPPTEVRLGLRSLRMTAII
jgi:hypothetical protein